MIRGFFVSKNPDPVPKKSRIFTELMFTTQDLFASSHAESPRLAQDLDESGKSPVSLCHHEKREVSRFPVSSRKAGSPLFPCDLAKAGRFLFWQKHFLCRPFFCPYGHTLTFSIEYQRNRRRCADRKGPDIPVRPFNVHEAISIKKQPARMAGCQKT